MQKPVPNYPPPTSLNPLKDAVGVSAVDYNPNLMDYIKDLTMHKFFWRKKSTWRVDKIPRQISKTAISTSTKRYTTKKTICR